MHDNARKFVLGLLKKSKRERLEGFRAFTARHPLLSKAYEVKPPS
jgi:hypothetical protein